MSAILDRIRGMFGEEGTAAKVMLFAMGQAAGHDCFGMRIDEASARTVKMDLPNLMSLYSAAGWGIFKAIDVDSEKGSGTVQAIDCFECAPSQGKKSKPYSQFIRGHIAGLFSELFGKRIDAVETECIACGDPHCQFLIGPKEGN